MKRTVIIFVVAVILSLGKDCNAVPVKRQQRVATEHQNQQPQRRQGFLPWYPGYPAMTGYQVAPPFLPIYPDMQYEGASYYPAVMELEDPYDFDGLEEYGFYHSGQKKKGTKHHPAE